eukprot:4158269-Prymnesium_polylepis.2
MEARLNIHLYTRSWHASPGQLSSPEHAHAHPSRPVARPPHPGRRAAGSWQRAPHARCRSPQGGPLCTGQGCIESGTAGADR